MADARRFAQSIPCIHCAYDLKGLPLASACPECGKPAHESLESLWCAEPASVRKLALWARVAGIGETADLIMTLAPALIGFVPGLAMSIFSFATPEILKRIAQCFAAFGCVMLGRPVSMHDGRKTGAFGGLRLVAAIQGVFAALAGVITFAPHLMQRMTGPVIVLMMSISLLATAAYGLRCALTFKRARWIAQRCNAPRISRVAAAGRWVGIVLCVGALGFGLIGLLGGFEAVMDFGSFGHLVWIPVIVLVLLLPLLLAGCLSRLSTSMRRIAQKTCAFQGPLLEPAVSQAPVSDT